MLAQLTLSQTLPATLPGRHFLVVLPQGKTLSKDMPHADLLAAVLKQRGMKADELVKSPVR